MAEALAAAHDLGVVHRDFEPGNVMLVPSRSTELGVRTVVTDFGLARGVATIDQGSADIVESLSKRSRSYWDATLTFNTRTYNPYLEGATQGGTYSNCLTCHNKAVYFGAGKRPDNSV